MPRASTKTSPGSKVVRPAKEKPTSSSTSRDSKPNIQHSYINKFSDEHVDEFLRKRKAVSYVSGEWTLSSGVIPMGKYLLDEDHDVSEFFQRYNHARNTKGTEFFCGLHEHPESEWPVVLRLQMDVIDDIIVSEIVSCVIYVLRVLLALDEDEAEERFKCFVMGYDSQQVMEVERERKRAPIAERRDTSSSSSITTFRDSERLDRTIILHFPGVFMSVHQLELLVYPNVHKQIEERVHNAHKIIIDINLFTTPHLLYGCQTYDTPPIKILNVTDSDGDYYPQDSMLQNGLRGYELCRAVKHGGDDTKEQEEHKTNNGEVTWTRFKLNPATEVDGVEYLPEVLSIHRRERKLYSVTDDNIPEDLDGVVWTWVTEQAMRRWHRTFGKETEQKVVRPGLKTSGENHQHSRHKMSTNNPKWQSKTDEAMSVYDEVIMAGKDRPGICELLDYHKRVENNARWKRVLTILFDYYGGHERGLKVLIDFTRPRGKRGTHRSHGDDQTPSQSDVSTLDDQNNNTDAEEDGGLDPDIIFEPGIPELESADENELKDYPHTAHRRQVFRTRHKKSRRTNRSGKTVPSSVDDENTVRKRCIWAWHKHVPTERHEIESIKALYEEDNRKEYHRIQQKDLMDCMNRMVRYGGNQHEIARFIARALKPEYVCVNTSHSHFYQWRNHRWNSQPGGAEFNVDAIRYVQEQCELAQQQWHEEIGELRSARNNRKMTARGKGGYNQNQTMEERDVYLHASADDDAGGDKTERIELIKDRMKKLDTLIGNLSKTGFQNAILMQCKQFLFVRDFEERLDSNPHLLGFNNGVLDLSQGKHGCGMFRAGRTSDYITKNCGYDFPVDIRGKNHPDVMRVSEHLLRVFTNPRVREYFLEFVGSLLKGGNPNKVVVFFNGGGHNGKSVTNNILTATLGDYCKTLPCAVLNGKAADSNAATPELAQLPGVRYVIFNEPEADKPISAGRFKELAGNDPFMTRALFGTPRVLIPMFKMCVTCNEEPSFTADDPAVWSRVRKVQFESLFDNSPEILCKSHEQQVKDKTFPRDNNFNELTPQMRRGMMWLMYYYYRKSVKIGTDPEPREVIEATLRYRIRNDAVDRFLRENITSIKRRERKDKAGNPIAGADGDDGSYMSEDSEQYKALVSNDRLKMDTTFDDMFKEYRKWFITQGLQVSKGKTPAMDNVLQSFIKFYGPPSKNEKGLRYWPGVFLKKLENASGFGTIGMKMVSGENDGVGLDAKVV